MDVDSTQAGTALLTEHLEYTPLSLIDDIINAVNTIAYQGIESLESALYSQAPQALGFPTVPIDESAGAPEPQNAARQEIEEGLHKLETLLGSAVDKNFDKFEIYVLRNILAVPQDLANWIRLQHYENLPYPPPANAATPESVLLLRKKVIASQTVSSALAKEGARNDTIIKRLQEITTGLSSDSSQPNLRFLTHAPAASAFNISASTSGQQPVTTNTNFALSQLPALKTILADLRPKLTQLKEKELGHNGAKDEQRDERRRYIEQRTKSRLDRNGQAMEPNRGIVAGREFDKDEIDAIERVANSVGTT